MQMILIQQASDLAKLAEQLQRSGGLDAVARWKALNPHLDLQRPEAGTVVLLPQAVEGSESVAAAVLGAWAAEARQGLKAAGGRIRGGLKQAEADDKALTAATRSAAFKRVLEGDAELADQLATARKSATAQRSLHRAQASDADTLAALLDDELQTLGRLLG